MSNKPMRYFITFLSLLTIFFLFFKPVTAITQDLGRHIKLGEIILQTHAVPHTNLFSYTYPDFPFTNTHWLSEVIFFLVNKAVGLTGLLILTTSIAVGVFALLFLLSKKQNIFVLGVGTVLYSQILIERTDLRPEIFSFFFLSLFLFILFRYREGFTRLIFLLPVLSLFWVNIHIYFFIGLLLIALFIIDGILTNWEKPTRRHTSILAFVFGLCCLTTLVNPSGIHGAMYPLFAMNNYGYSIEENQNIFFLWGLFQKQTILFFWIATLLLFGGLAANAKRSRPIDWLLSITFVLFGIFAIRNFALFVFCTFPVFVHVFSGVTDVLLFERSRELKSFSIRFAHSKNILTIATILLLIGNIFFFTTSHKVGTEIVSGGRGAADFFITHKLSGPVFNNFDIGSYLIYRLYPKTTVFVDGRPEGYPQKFFSDVYIPMQEDQAKFANVDKKYVFSTIVFSHTDQTPWARQFLSDIGKNPTWKLVYLDDYAVIFVKENAANKALISAFGMTEKNLTIGHIENTKESLYPAANALHLFGFTQKEKDVYQGILEIDPSNCYSLYNLAVLFGTEQNPIANIYNQKYADACH